MAIAMFSCYRLPWVEIAFCDWIGDRFEALDGYKLAFSPGPGWLAFRSLIRRSRSLASPALSALIYLPDDQPLHCSAYKRTNDSDAASSKREPASVAISCSPLVRDGTIPRDVAGAC